MQNILDGNKAVLHVYRSLPLKANNSEKTLLVKRKIINFLSNEMFVKLCEILSPRRAFRRILITLEFPRVKRPSLFLHELAVYLRFSYFSDSYVFVHFESSIPFQ